ncbi:MAG: histidinol dehydrogenase [Bryobacteraceae bacterium]|nr:histidinol dehydrogenase [Bryobacteraceae bacterium]
MIRILEAKQAGKLMERKAARFGEAEAIVRPILEAVRRRGDKALLEYGRQFDGLTRRSVVVPVAELKAAESAVAPQFKSAVRAAAKNIRAFAKLQLPVAKKLRIAPGIVAGQVVRPLDVVGAYVPAGRYPLPSTLLMTVIPAQAAGVPTICVTSPKVVPEIYATASLLGIQHVFQVGGAQAIAALAYGTRSIPKADRIVGPGNIYVAAAKKLLAGEVGIDFVAGPTEILIIAADGDPRWIAADMLAQAEHDTDASAILLTTSKPLALAVQQEIELQLTTLSTAGTARIAINKNSAILLVASLDEAAELSNRFAPEHLSLHDAALLPLIRHAGGVFLGAASPEAAGDYAAGPNHVLPTSGAARLRGGLSSADFVKVIATQSLTARGLRDLAPTVTTLARAEGLEAHARSVEVRIS